MSYTSKYTGQEIDNKLDKIGEVGVLDSMHAQLKETWVPSVGGIIPFTKISGNMEITNGKIKIKPGQRVQIDVQLCSKTNTPSIKINRNFAIKDITNDIEIQGIYPIMNTGDNTMDYQSAFSYSAQYTNETDKECEIAVVCTAIYSGGTPHMLSESGCGITVFEIGCAMVVPSEYKEVELLSAPIEVAIPTDFSQAFDVSLLDDITKYDALQIVTDIKANPSVSTKSGHYQHNTTVIRQKSVIYHDSDTTVDNGSRMNISILGSELEIFNLGYWFRNPTTIRICQCKSNQSRETYSHVRVYSITGIKY